MPCLSDYSIATAYILWHPQSNDKCVLSLNDNIIKVGVTDGEDAPPNNLVSRRGLTPQDEQFKHQHHGWRHTGLGWQHCVDALVKLEGGGGD